MKTVIDFVFDLSAFFTIVGIIGLPFFSFTIWACMSISETIDDFREYGWKGMFDEGDLWLNRHDRLVTSLGLSIFPLATILFVVIGIIRILSR
jgi:hypothetical protein